MKLRPANLIQPQTSETLYAWEHPWDTHVREWEVEQGLKLNKPNPPSQQDIEKAKFIDKTYVWSRDDSVRSGNKRSTP